MKTLAIATLACALAWAACATDPTAEDPNGGDPTDTTTVGSTPRATTDNPFSSGLGPVVEPDAPRGAPATPEMIAAALSGDPQAMAKAMPLPNYVCVGPTSCSADFASCTAWSAPVTCDAPHCGTNAQCVYVYDNNPKPRFVRYSSLVTTSEQYRICFNPAGQTCTQRAQQTNNAGCDLSCCTSPMCGL